MWGLHDILSSWSGLCRWYHDAIRNTTFSLRTCIINPFHLQYKGYPSLYWILTIPLHSLIEKEKKSHSTGYQDAKFFGTPAIFNTIYFPQVCDTCASSDWILKTLPKFPSPAQIKVYRNSILPSDSSSSLCHWSQVRPKLLYSATLTGQLPLTIQMVCHRKWQIYW
jgi:hypothetical protein